MSDIEREGLVGRFMGNVLDFFKVQFKTVWEDYTQVWPNAVIKAFDRTLEWFGLKNDDGIISFYTDLKEWGVFDDNDIERLRNTFNHLGIFRIPLMFLIGMFTFMNAFKMKIVAATGTWQQNLNKAYTPLPPPVDALLRALFIAPEKTDFILDRLASNGFDIEDIKVMIESQYRTYDENMIRTLYLRGLISREKMFERMRELGYTDTRIQEMEKAFEQLPSMQDIVRYIGKEVFEPAMIDTFGLMEDYPEHAEEDAKKIGVNPRWVKAEWVAHWQDIGLNYMLEGLHRDVVQWDEVERYMRLVEIAPRFRELIRDVSYNPLTRVDTRRMQDLGVLDAKGVFRSYLDQGYSPENAMLMTQWTLKYNRANDRDLAKTEIIRAYKAKVFDFETAVSSLVDSGYSKIQAEFLIGLEDLKETTNTNEILLDAVKDSYTSNLINDLEVRQRLAELDISGERIEALIARWGVQRFKGKAHHSKTDLGKMYWFKVIDEDDYRREMSNIGYTHNQIIRYLELMKKTKKPV